MPTIRFETELVKIGPWTVVRLPANASTKLPSRGQTMVEGTISGVHFKTPLEPDGRWSHWFTVDESLLKTLDVTAGDTLTLAIEPTKEWIEPDVPADWQQALAASPEAHALWKQITPMARWEWIRWARATNNADTRKRRIEVGISKLKAGKRRPCCWNRNACSEPSVSKNGMLLEPTPLVS